MRKRIIRTHEFISSSPQSVKTMQTLASAKIAMAEKPEQLKHLDKCAKVRIPKGVKPPKNVGFATFCDLSELVMLKAPSLNEPEINKALNRVLVNPNTGERLIVPRYEPVNTAFVSEPTSKRRLIRTRN